jgi:hypothetical protein
MVESQREIPGSAGADTIERETRFYITSLTWIAALNLIRRATNKDSIRAAKSQSGTTTSSQA